MQVVDGSGNPLSGVVDIAAGDRHTVYLKEDGTVWAVGNNFLLQLGTGTAIDRRQLGAGGGHREIRVGWWQCLRRRILSHGSIYPRFRSRPAPIAGWVIMTVVKSRDDLGGTGSFYDRSLTPASQAVDGSRRIR